MTLTVTNVNAAPVFDRLDGLTVQEGGQRLVFGRLCSMRTIPDSCRRSGLRRRLGGVEGSDPSVDYVVTGLPTGALFDTDSILFDWSPQFDAAGTYVVRFTAVDDGNGTGTLLSSSIDVPIAVRNTNRAPVEQALENIVLQRGDVREIALAFPDPDGNLVTLTAAGLPPYAQLMDRGDGTGVLRLTPGANDRGSAVVTLTATDDGDR